MFMRLRDLLRPRARLTAPCRAALSGLRALEVGGPSRLFTRRGRLPVYAVLEALDLMDTGDGALWGGAAKRPPDLPPGERLRGEAVALEGIAPGAYDALLASHVLEHVADPLGALGAFRRVVGAPGWTVIVLPHPAGTFDHRRPVTSLDHLVEDHAAGRGEDDLSHLDEILRLHDIERDPGAGSREAFELRSRDNVRVRALHHHVFDPALAVGVLDRAGYAVVALEVVRPYHLVLLARADGEGRGENPALLAADAPWRRRSPFAGDRLR